MGSSQIRWKQERSNMMAGELVDPVKATKLLVFMCLDCPSPWGHYIRSGGGGAQLAELRTHVPTRGVRRPPKPMSRNFPRPRLAAVSLECRGARAAAWAPAMAASREKTERKDRGE
ncbi:unnamed protein product [Miscanthus lutarioriparius]|uniref:Uncharacterized protein n=1 Tax=Miscanthus lutarioriparius TaxID=422564 RepID=A0A811PT16_9POAL|nr:unnamed protein product [Miscanthus lutarioriparius]